MLRAVADKLRELGHVPIIFDTTSKAITMRFFLLTAIFLFLTGCASVPPAIIEKPEQRNPIQSQSENSKLIFVANVTVKQIDKKVGQLTIGGWCGGQKELFWKDNQGVVNSIKEVISATLAKNGYKVYSGLIQAGGEKDAEILIGVGIEDIRANMCLSVDGQKGEASMRLKFEVLDNKTRASFVATETGAASIEAFKHAGDAELFNQAAEMATRNFLAEEEFFKITRK